MFTDLFRRRFPKILGIYIASICIVVQLLKNLNFAFNSYNDICNRLIVLMNDLSYPCIKKYV